MNERSTVKRKRSQGVRRTQQREVKTRQRDEITAATGGATAANARPICTNARSTCANGRRIRVDARRNAAAKGPARANGRTCRPFAAVDSFRAKLESSAAKPQSSFAAMRPAFAAMHRTFAATRPAFAGPRATVCRDAPSGCSVSMSNCQVFEVIVSIGSGIRHHDLYTGKTSRCRLTLSILPRYTCTCGDARPVRVGRMRLGRWEHRKELAEASRHGLGNRRGFSQRPHRVRLRLVALFSRKPILCSRSDKSRTLVVCRVHHSRSIGSTDISSRHERP